MAIVDVGCFAAQSREYDAQHGYLPTEALPAIRKAIKDDFTKHYPDTLYGAAAPASDKHDVDEEADVSANNDTLEETSLPLLQDTE